MKKILSHFICVAFFSCKKDDAVNTLKINLVGNWKLIQMTGSFSNSQTTGTDMEWQESYQLNTDGTFLKSRDRDGMTINATGTYSINNTTNQTLLTLNFGLNNGIIATCYGGTTEELYLDSNTLNGTWHYCDGPGLKYEKVQN